MVGFSEKCVSMIHVRDLIRGFVMAAESDKAVGETYFISSKDVYDWGTIGDVANDIMKKRTLRIRIPESGVYVIAAFAEFFSIFSSKAALINFEKAREMVQNYWTCDASKAKRDFGFEQQIQLKEGFRETIDWYREHKML
jgi:nucleoside-diphosphate-sugar epimerase